jgi:endoglucanase
MLTGVNYAGAEFGTNLSKGQLPGRLGQDYVYPKTAALDYFIDRGLSTIRLPIRWERLQREFNAEFWPEDISHVDAVINHVTFRGGNVVIDVHNYGRYLGDYISEPAVPTSAFVDLWVKFAEAYKGNPRVIFGLMNEPQKQPVHSAANWRGIVDEVVAAIRSTGARNLILVPGTNWTGAHSWMGSNADAFQSFNDENFAFEVHQYFDSDSSGRSATAVSPTIGRERITKFTEWCKARSARGWLGEFGIGNNTTAMAAGEDMLSYMDANADVWLGWSAWAAGSRWGSYIFSLEPLNGADRPQIPLLVAHADEGVPEPTPEPEPDPIPDPVPDPVPGPTPDPTPDPTPEPTPENERLSISLEKRGGKWAVSALRQ